MNILIHDRSKNEVERFEPYGNTHPADLNYDPQLLDDLLQNMFKKIDNTIQYIRPNQYLPKIGFQLFEVQEEKHHHLGDPDGFCALWCLWYADQRIENTKLSRSELIDLLFRTLRNNNIKLKNMIRNYSNQIIKLRDDVLIKNNANVNDWKNGNMTDEQMNGIYVELHQLIHIA